MLENMKNKLINKKQIKFIIFFMCEKTKGGYKKSRKE